MMKLVLLLMVTMVGIDCRPHSVNKGYFWQVTDFHYDVNYTLHGDPSRMCHYSSSGVHYDLGMFGDYNCDSPWNLVQSSINAMSSIHPNPDFILWTGDSVPHVDGNTYDEADIFNIIRNVTDAMIAKFPSTTILPSFGNHDPYPSNQMPANDPFYYAAILNNSHWSHILSANSDHTFLRGGYYAHVISPHVKVLSLNTALYYSMNNVTQITDKSDPSGQLAWLTSELEQSKLANQKVYISAHVPPGTFELAPDFKWFHDDLSTAYLDIIDQYQDVISAHFYGHEHTDSFRVSESHGGHSTMFLSPAVTPWKSSIPGVGSNNPSIRLYVYDKDTSDLLDYYQYYLNLAEANKVGSAQWKLEYQFTEAYGVADLTPNSVKKAAGNILADDDNAYLTRYIQYNSVSAADHPTCDDDCLHNHRCAIRHVRHDELTRCLMSANNHHHKTTDAPHHHHKEPARMPGYVTWIIVGMAVVLLFLAIAVMVLCFRPRQYVLVGRTHGRVNGYGAIKS